MKLKYRLLAILIFLILLCCIFILQRAKADVVKSKYFGYVEKGGKNVKTSPSTQFKLMETYPQATITIYEAGTLTLANIWSDRDGLVVKANPFIVDTDSFYFFYIDCGKYDIKFSGTGIATPYTYGDVAICGITSSGGGNVTTLGGTTDFIVKFTSSTSIGDSQLFNPTDQVRAASTTLFGWTDGSATANLDVAFGRNSSDKIEINTGVLGSLAKLTLHRIEPIPTATIPGLNFGPIATDPTNPVLGDCWYNTSLSAFRCFIGSTVTLSTGSGITSINDLTAAAQFLVVGTSGSDFNINSTTATHTFNLPDASLTARGVVNTIAQSFNGDKTFDDNVIITSNIVNSFLYSDSTKAVQTTLAPTNGQILIGSTGIAPVVANITGDSMITIVNTAGGIQVTCPTCSSGAVAGCVPTTDNRIPYRINATTCGDSPFQREGDAIIGLLSPTDPTNNNTTEILKIYGVYTNASNNDYLQIWRDGANEFTIATLAVGTGVQKALTISADAIHFNVDIIGGTTEYTTAWEINGNLHDGNFQPGPDLTYDIGTNSHRVRWIYSADSPTFLDNNFAKSSDTTLASITGLTRTVQNGKKFKFEADLYFDADGTGGHKWAISGSATVSAVIYQITTVCNASTDLVITSRQTSLGGNAAQAGCTAGHTKITGTARVNGTGTIGPQFAQSVASGTSTVLANSTFQIELIEH